MFCPHVTFAIYQEPEVVSVQLMYLYAMELKAEQFSLIFHPRSCQPIRSFINSLISYLKGLPLILLTRAWIFMWNCINISSVCESATTNSSWDLYVSYGCYFLHCSRFDLKSDTTLPSPRTINWITRRNSDNYTLCSVAIINFQIDINLFSL